ncbi:MAG: hypothetical protein D6681_04400, partial [Calditrichaeota bacterium]
MWQGRHRSSALISVIMEFFYSLAKIGTLLCLISALWGIPVQAQEQLETYSGVRIYIDKPSDVLQLLRAGLEFDHLHFQQDYIEVALSSRDMQRLQQTGYRYEVLIPDLSAFYQERASIPRQE